MGSVVAFGLGIFIGALAAFGAGRRYERAHHAGLVAAEHFGTARHYAGKAIGSVALAVLVVVVGGVIVWAGS